MILRGNTKTEQIIGQLRKKNNEVLGEVEVIDYWGKSSLNSLATKKVKAEAFCPYDSVIKRLKKLRWLSQCQNQRSNAFHSLSNLLATGVINEEERQLFELPPGISDYPFRLISQFHRVLYVTITPTDSMT